MDPTKSAEAHPLEEIQINGPHQVDRDVGLLKIQAFNVYGLKEKRDEPEFKKTREGNTEDDETKWCFYVRGVNTTVHIKDKDLTEKEYEELRNSYADRLKVMNDKKAELGPCDPGDW